MAEVKLLVEPSLEVEGTRFQVLRYDLTESLSELSRLRCAVTELDVEPKNPAELIGKTAILTLARTDGIQRREFVGRVVVAAREVDEDDVRCLSLEVAPVPWALSKRADCRVFQHQTVVDIAKAVLEAAGVPADQQDWRVTEEHPEKEYLVQYRETDLDFLWRILAEEGIYFAVHHEDGADKLVFGDDPRGLGDVEEPTALPYHYGHGGDEAIDAVMRLVHEHTVTSDKVTLRDYTPDKPKLDVTATVESDDDGDHVLEIYDYPARAADPSEAERLAKILLDEHQAPRQVVRGEAGVLHLRPGLRVTLEGHPYAPLNQEYLITGVSIVGSTPRLGAAAEAEAGQRYRLSFTAVPTETTRYRPAPRPRQARVAGLQTAVTTGASGEEIHTNESGAVKIRYHWDRLGPEDDGSSLWCRTSQLALGGSMLLPRMGWEVSVDHLEGDPDRPLVMGRMYNGEKPPPYKLPDEAVKSALQTATSPGGGSTNELRTSDGAGSEEMFFNASKDMTVDVKNNTTESVGSNSTRSIGANQAKNVTNSVTATVGANQSLSVGGDQAIKVETKLQDEVGADHSLTIGGNRDMKIGGDHKRDVSGNATHDVGAMMVDLVVGSTTEEILGDYKHDVGAALVDITVADRVVAVTGSITETAGAAKVIAVNGGRGVSVDGSMMQQVAGAIINVASGDRAESSGATYTEIAAGAQVVKANNITIEADGMITLVMGASILNMNPAMITLMGVSIKLDGKTADLGALIVDN